MTKPKFNGTYPHPPISSSGRDWVEDFKYENGNYLNTCGICRKSFFGHKRRGVCKLCGITQLPMVKQNGQISETPEEVHDKNYDSDSTE